MVRGMRERVREQDRNVCVDLLDGFAGRVVLQQFCPVQCSLEVQHTGLVVTQLHYVREKEDVK